MSLAVISASTWEEVRVGMAEDIAVFWAGPALKPVVMLSLSLPLAAIVVLFKTRNLLVLLPLAYALGILTLWVLLYASDWFSVTEENQGIFFIVLISWTLLIFCLISHAHRARPALPRSHPRKHWWTPLQPL
jgi:hypothetical protein